MRPCWAHRRRVGYSRPGGHERNRSPIALGPLGRNARNYAQGPRTQIYQIERNNNVPIYFSGGLLSISQQPLCAYSV